MIELQGVTKYFGKLAAVRDLTCRVDSGQVVGFLGPNGAGKTTAMRLMTHYLQADQGTISIDGEQWKGREHRLGHLIGYLPGQSIREMNIEGI